MKELSIDEKAKRYDDALERAKIWQNHLFECGDKDYAEELNYILPELKESEDERIRRWLICGMNALKEQKNETFATIPIDDAIAWLEKQGKETGWKPSKEEMDVLYGLAYITNQYDEHKEEVITRLYQDLKREFFNGSSYENVFPNTEDDVRRRSTIQVLEYARSLDTYNQYGKADIDKNIAWLEKQGEQNLLLKMKSPEESLGISAKEYNEVVNDSLYGESKYADNVEPNFKVGDWIVCERLITAKIIKINGDYYEVEFIDGSKGLPQIDYIDRTSHLWTIKDAKDGDVLISQYNNPFIYDGYRKYSNVGAYGGILPGKNFNVPDENYPWTGDVNIQPATKEQRDLLFQKMKEAGYEFDFEKKELKIIVK